MKNAERNICEAIKQKAKSCLQTNENPKATPHHRVPSLSEYTC